MQQVQRIFVSGDRSSVGKSTVCLGLLGALVDSGLYQPSELAYIKPATQCQDVQLVAKFCESKGIAHRGLGPVVYYSGFTREVLRGEFELTAEQMLDKVEEAVTAISQGKKLVVVDGVGYPSVGSVVGVSNAHMAKKLGAKVLLVGKHGVGDAIDSFNLNAVFFEHFGVRVAGTIFNKIETDSYEDVKKHVSLYFEKNRQDVPIFGFIPLAIELAEPGATASEKKTCMLATKETLKITEKEEELCKSIVDTFRKYVDVEALHNAF